MPLCWYGSARTRELPHGPAVQRSIKPFLLVRKKKKKKKQHEQTALTEMLIPRSPRHSPPARKKERTREKEKEIYAGSLLNVDRREVFSANRRSSRRGKTGGLERMTGLRLDSPNHAQFGRCGSSSFADNSAYRSPAGHFNFPPERCSAHR